MPPAEIVPSLPSLVAARVLDVQLAALVWLLLEDGVPVLVAAGETTGGDEVIDAFAAALPADRRPAPAASAGAVALSAQTPAPVPAAGNRLVRVPGRLALSTPAGTLRSSLSATTGRTGMAAVIDATDLAAVLAVLRGQGLSDDEISFLGVVLVQEVRSEPTVGGSPPARVIAAHYLRPVARDAGGHVQRLGPAVLATWDPARAVYDHFAWGIYPELAARTRRRAGDLEREQEERMERLQSAAAHDPI